MLTIGATRHCRNLEHSIAHSDIGRYVERIARADDLIYGQHVDTMIIEIKLHSLDGSEDAVAFHGAGNGVLCGGRHNASSKVTRRPCNMP